MKRDDQDEQRGVTTTRDREAIPAEREARQESTRRLTPACDAYETEDKVVVVADMPGVDQDSLDVSLHRGLLTMRGRIRRPLGGEFTPFDGERIASAFHRTLALSPAVDPDSVEATIRDGVLRIELTKRPEERPRRIAITRA